jgi:hypothetical protein
MQLDGQNRIVVRDLLQFKIEEMYDVHEQEELLKDTQWIQYNKIMDGIVAEQGFEDYPSDTYRNARYFYRGLPQNKPIEMNWSNEEHLMMYGMFTRMMYECKGNFEHHASMVGFPFGYTEDNFFDTWNEFEIEMVAYMHKNLKWTVNQMCQFTTEEHRGLFNNMVDMFEGREPGDTNEEEYDNNLVVILHELSEATDRLIEKALIGVLNEEDLIKAADNFSGYDEIGAEEILNIWQEAYTEGHFKGLQHKVAREMYDKMMKELVEQYM